MSLADILAKKKAAAEAASPSPLIGKEVVVTVTQKADELPQVTAIKEAAKPAVEKPLTFAEKMALKRQQAAVQDVVARSVSPTATATSKKEVDLPNVVAPVTEPAQPVSSLAESPVSIPVLQDTGKQKAIVDPSSIKGTIEEALENKTANADPATAQAYADIAIRLQTLADLSDTDLKNAMSDLKKALLANPNAVSLMEDTDYAQMVIALRRLTKEDQVEATKEKTTGRKKKSTLDLSDPAAVEAAFAEF